jgi:F-type H+-transporting ATPase subunit b
MPAFAVALLSEAAAHEASRGFLGFPTTVWSTLNLLLFFALLYVLLKKPSVSFFGGRRGDVAKALQKAAEDRGKAEALAGEVKERLSRVETELAQIQVKARQEAVAEQAALTKQAEEDAARIVARTSSEMENRVRAAKVELAAYAADLSVDLARELLAKNVTRDDEKRLLDEGVARLTGAVKS